MIKKSSSDSTPAYALYLVLEWQAKKSVTKKKQSCTIQGVEVKDHKIKGVIEGESCMLPKIDWHTLSLNLG
jgi:hypothetical protein